MCAFKPASGQGNSNGVSQAYSPPDGKVVGWDLLYAAAGEVARMRMMEDTTFEIEVVDRSRIGEKLVDLDFLERYAQQGGIERHTMRELVGSIRLIDFRQFDCSEWIEEPELLVTRFE